jgi:hypothetical protein
LLTLIGAVPFLTLTVPPLIVTGRVAVLTGEGMTSTGRSTVSITGEGRFTALLDEQGLNEVVHVHERTVGTISANGIELRDFASLNSTFDFRTFTHGDIAALCAALTP